MKTEAAEHVSLEVCVEAVEAAIAAERGGAHRIELCSALLEGGLTPSYGLVLQTLKQLTIPVYVMIRPRGGDFLYSAMEFKIMRQDILQAKSLGAAGVVLGILTADGRIDVERTRELVQLARPMQVTFHRAFDRSANLLQSLEDVIATGADRILTSGGATVVTAGTEQAAAVFRQAAGRIAIMAGSGVNASNVRSIMQRTGILHYHASLRKPMESAMQFHNQQTRIASGPADEYTRFTVHEEDVRQCIDMLQLQTTSLDI